MNFKDKTVVITGGTGALGSAVTTAFLQAGAKVFVTFRSEQEFEALKASVNASAALTGIKTNVLDEASVKAGLINFTQSLAAEGKRYNITANAVIPGIIDTPANRQAMPNANYAEWLSPEALAQVILFLSSEEAQAITGATIPVGG